MAVLDRDFLNYGIRKEDLELIDLLCETHKLDKEWIREEILAPFHAQKIDAIGTIDNSSDKTDEMAEVVDKAVEKVANKVINSAINKIKTT